MIPNAQRYFLRVFGNGHGGFFRASNSGVTPDGWHVYGKPLEIVDLSYSKAHKQARDYRNAGYVVRIVPLVEGWSR